MWLIGMPKVRVKKYPKGWVVERKHRTWYGKRYWKHIISVTGIKDEPWYFKSIDSAVEEAKHLFGWDLHYGNRNFN